MYFVSVCGTVTHLRRRRWRKISFRRAIQTTKDNQVGLKVMKELCYLPNLKTGWRSDLFIFLFFCLVVNIFFKALLAFFFQTKCTPNLSDHYITCKQCRFIWEWTGQTSTTWSFFQHSSSRACCSKTIVYLFFSAVLPPLKHKWLLHRDFFLQE